jgi:hypothetical protein
VAGFVIREIKDTSKMSAERRSSMESRNCNGIGETSSTDIYTHITSCLYGVDANLT